MRTRSIGLTAASVAAAVVVAGMAAAPGATRTTYTHGYDVSWPQCSGSSATHMPAARPAYVILGLTHGTGHTINPCLGSQVAWARDRQVKVGAYLVPSYPTPWQRHQSAAACSSGSCALLAEGERQASDAVATMRAQGVPAPMVWVDVEFRHQQPWSHHKAANAKVIRGVVLGLRRAGLRVGVYTTGYMWRAITGGLRLDVPNWLPSGDGKPDHAKAKCRTSATGGVTWLVQYTRSLDENLTCPVLDGTPARHNKLWRYRHTTKSLGSRGAAVRALQRIVGTSVSGQFGAMTSLAVSRWQRDHSLDVTGEVTPVDWRAMGAFRTTGGRPFGLNKIVARA